jgi:hypothetical protein
VTIRNMFHVPCQVQHDYCLMAAFINETHRHTWCAHTDSYHLFQCMKKMLFACGSVDLCKCTLCAVF